MKYRKRIISGLLILAMLASFLPTGVFSLTSSAKETCIEFSGYNLEDQDYFGNHAKPIYSYLIETADGQLMRVEAGGLENAYFVEYYDSSRNVVRTLSVGKELPIFGGFYATDTNYYILSGQTNYDEKASVECFRITKYDLNWKRISSAGLYDCNTTVPFNASSARFAESGKYLLIRTGHEMYRSSDGRNHQANVTIQLDTETMTITDSYTEISNSSSGYVSHSFNQFIHIEDEKIVSVDHGDAYPRSIVLMIYQNDVSDGSFTGGNQSVNVKTFPGEFGDNFTGTMVGGFEISDSSYLVAYSSIDMNDEDFTAYTRNVYIGSVDKSSLEVTTTQLTFYTEDDESVSAPHLVKLSNREFMVLWSHDASVYYAKLDTKGNLLGSIYCIKTGYLSDCKPIVTDGKVVWYTSYDTETTFYEIDPTDLSDYKITIAEGGHDYKINYPTKLGGTCKLECNTCGHTESFATASGMTVYWNTEASYGSFSDELASTTFHVGDHLWGLAVNDGSDRHAKMLVSVSDPSAVLLENFSDGVVHLNFKKTGSYTVTFTDPYNPLVVKRTTFKVVAANDGSGCSHNYIKGKVTAPTCLRDGYTAYTCSKCGKTEKRDVTYALGHNYLEVVTPPTCTEQGYTTNTCDRCKDSYVIDRMDPLGHTYDIDYPTEVGGECTVNCTVCGYTHTFVSSQGIRVGWLEPGKDSYNYGNPNRYYQTGDVLGVYFYDSNYDLAEEFDQKIVTVSDPEGVTYAPFIYCMGDFIFNKAGTYTLTISDTYNPLVTKSITVIVEEANGCSHESWKITKYPTELGGDCTIECADCGRTRTFATSTGMKVGWCTDGNPWYTIPLDKHFFEIGDMIGYSISVEDITIYPSKKIVTVSDPMGAVHDDSEQSITFVRPGVYTVTITDEFNPLVTESVTVTVTGSGDETAADNGCAHSYTTSVIAPVCTVQGYTVHSCARCGDEYLTDFADPIGHDYADPVSNGDGSMTVFCKRCGFADTVRDELSDAPLTEEAVYKILMSLKDDYPEEVKWKNNDFYRWNGVGYYGGFGYIAFSYILSDAAFGDLPEEEIEGQITLDMLHVGDIIEFKNGWVSVIVLEIYEDHIVCGSPDYLTTVNWEEIFTAEKIETYASCILHRYPEGTHFHRYPAVVTAPTCTEQGYTTHICTCGDSYVDSYTDALGHSLGEWYITVEPTDEALGEERRDCANCDYFETREVGTLVPGDVDCSDVFDLLDILLMQQYLSGWDVELDTLAGDVNDDGETNLLDVLLMQQSLAGWDVELK